ncbi:MAG: hypothetical protein JO227_22105 [Acetobacteraceae bacterium]|nr:hypothetical protein [Acetobacteraceae bacterium]
MNWIKAVPKQLLALFVDDGRLFAGTLAWIAFTWIVTRLQIVPAFQWAILFSGLALILAYGAFRGVPSRHSP